MGTPVVGKVGKVTYGASPTFVQGVNEWKVNPKGSTVDITEFLTGNDAAWKAYLATLKEWEGSIELAYVDLTDTNGQYAMWLALGGAAANIRLYMTATKYLLGTIIITGFPISAAVSGVESGSISFQGTGSLTYT